jgi:transcriptional regulator with XRE-family HTH domain
MIDKSFATVLRRLRIRKRLSQEEFGFEADLHRTYVSQLERGLKSPSLKTLHKIANVLEISLTELMTLVEQEDNASSANQR